jgi:hypothetical protein
LLIIGSKALVHHLKDIGREPKDTDFICTEAEWLDCVETHTFSANLIERNGNKGHIFSGDRVHFEFDIAQEGDSNDLILQLTEGKLFAPLDVLLLLKLSHRYKKNSPHFMKTMWDIHKLRAHDAKITPELEPILKLREKETYTYAHPKLNVTKKEFFNGDDVPYVYDHDSIHEVVAFLDRPAYTYYMTDGEQVKASMDKFFEQDRYIQLLGVLEESMVLAAERSQIPNNFELSPRLSFNIALEKVCTSITSGRFREFAWESYYIVQQMYDKLGGDAWVEKVKQAIAENKLRPFEGEH